MPIPTKDLRPPPGTPDCRKSSLRCAHGRPGHTALSAWKPVAALVALALGLLAPTASTPQAITARATSDPARVCETWAAIAAAEHGVPEALMIGIARIETGRTTAQGLRSWPWTVNAEGEGRWFRSRAEAHAYAADRLAAGAGQVDLGCFQINHGWHGRAFGGLDAMLDPAENARYAARFLAALEEELGNWTRAAAAYHSRTPHLGRTYLARLAPVIEAIRQPSDGAPPPVPALPSLSGPGEARGLGSLVPLAGLVGPARIEPRPSISGEAVR